MFEINKKEDIIIPFDKIGSENWDVKTKQIIQSVAEFWGNELKDPISKDEIQKLENRLRATLPNSLKIFYQTFGLADIGEVLQELNEIGWIKDIFGEIQPENEFGFTEEDKKHLPFLISFSDCLGNGNMFCFHSETKEIFYYHHDGEPHLAKMFDTVDTYLKCCLIFAQADLLGEAKLEDTDEWTEEIVSEIIGEKTVKKWRY